MFYFMNVVHSFVNYAIFRELCDRMRFEVDCAKSHHCIISESLTNSSKNRPDLYFIYFQKMLREEEFGKYFADVPTRNSRYHVTVRYVRSIFKEGDFRKTLTRRVELKNAVNPSIFKPSAPSPTKIVRNDFAVKRHWSSSERKATSNKR